MARRYPVRQSRTSVAELIADVLVIADDSDEQVLVFAVLEKVMAVWGDPTALEAVPYDVHLYRTVLLVVLAARIHEKHRAVRGMEVISWLMKVEEPLRAVHTTVG